MAYDLTGHMALATRMSFQIIGGRQRVWAGIAVLMAVQWMSEYGTISISSSAPSGKAKRLEDCSMAIDPVCVMEGNEEAAAAIHR